MLDGYGCLLMEKKITALQAQKNHPDRINVHLDGEFAFGVSRFVAAGLTVGQTLSHSEIEALKSQDVREKAYQSALRYIGFKQRTQQEVVKKLVNSGYGDGVIQSVVAELTEKQYIDDAQYAEQWLETRVSSHPRSQRLMALELRRRGIPEETIQQALKNAPGDDGTALALAENFIRKNQNLDDEKLTQKLKGVLARKGFSFDVIQDVIEQINEKRKSVME